jgi:hypothetical protein
MQGPSREGRPLFFCGSDASRDGGPGGDVVPFPAKSDPFARQTPIATGVAPTDGYFPKTSAIFR